jgi:hypothetical protein
MNPYVACPFDCCDNVTDDHKLSNAQKMTESTPKIDTRAWANLSSGGGSLYSYVRYLSKTN